MPPVLPVEFECHPERCLLLSFPCFLSTPRPGSPGAHSEASIQNSRITHRPGYEAAILLLVAAVSLSSVSPGCEEGTL